jgi:photosystem II stability/assembly factor-like uncharacterized protein
MNKRYRYPLLLLALLPLGRPGKDAWWSVQTSGIDTNLRGVSAKCCEETRPTNFQDVVWASGSNGVILRSADYGRHWTERRVKGGEDLDFRGIAAVDTDTAYVMSSGDADKSRIYKTTDGGKSWGLQYSDKRAGFFLDSLACDSKVHCVALSDPVDGKFLLLSTGDGEHWKEMPRDKMPASLPKEGAFAASGTAITLCEDGKIFFATGGPAARIFRSTDHGYSWTVQETPIVSGNASSGIFSLACYYSDRLVAVGGDYKQPDRSSSVAIYSEDGGGHWQLAKNQPGGYRSAVGWSSQRDAVAVGPNGTDVSHDGGVHWQRADPLSLNAVCFEASEGWGVGPKGTIARFNSHYQYLVEKLVAEKP